MEAGRLDRKIMLYRPEFTYDSANQPVKSWVPVGPVSALKTDVSDGERIAAQQVGANLTSRFQIRRSRQVADLSAAWQLGLLNAGVEVARYQLTGVKDLLAHTAFGRRVGFELTALAMIDGDGPPDAP